MCWKITAVSFPDICHIQPPFQGDEKRWSQTMMISCEGNTVNTCPLSKRKLILSAQACYLGHRHSTAGLVLLRAKAVVAGASWEGQHRSYCWKN